VPSSRELPGVIRANIFPLTFLCPPRAPGFLRADRSQNVKKIVLSSPAAAAPVAMTRAASTVQLAAEDHDGRAVVHRPLPQPGQLAVEVRP